MAVKKVKVEAKDILKSNTRGSKKSEMPELEEKEESTSSMKVRPTSERLSGKLHWYVLSIQPGYELSVAKAINQRIAAMDLKDLIKDIVVPTQKKIVIKNGKQEIKDERIFPGYVIVNMKLNPTTWELVTGVEGVSGFVKTDKYPRPLPEDSVQAIKKFKEVEQPAYKTSFSVGEAAKITDGAFKDLIGNIQEINEKKGKVKILVSFLGREAPVELDFSQIAKL